MRAEVEDKQLTENGGCLFYRMGIVRNDPFMTVSEVSLGVCKEKPCWRKTAL